MLGEMTRMMVIMVFLRRLPAYVHDIASLESLPLFRLIQRTSQWPRHGFYGFKKRPSSATETAVDVSDYVCPQRPGSFIPGVVGV